MTERTKRKALLWLFAVAGALAVVAVVSQGDEPVTATNIAKAITLPVVYLGICFAFIRIATQREA